MDRRDKKARWGWLLLYVVGSVPCGAVGQAATVSATCPVPAALQGRRLSGAQGASVVGEWFLGHGQSACAVASYREALRTEPHSTAVLDGLARSYLAQGDPAAALSLLRNAPAAEALTVDLATAFEETGDTDRAGQTLVRAVRGNPKSARLASALVLLMANHGQMDEAYALAEKFARLHPRDLNAQKLYLRVLVAANDVATARPMAKKLLLANQADGELLYLNGVLERKAGEFEAARGHLQRSVEINPDFADAHYNLGLVLQQTGDAKGASEQIEDALRLGAKDPEVHLNLSKALRSLGQTTEAEAQLAMYQQAIKAKSDDAMAAGKAADAEQAMSKGDKQKAVALYREALEVEPRNASLAYQLAMALDASGDTAGERTALESAVANDPANALAQHQLGYLLFTGGENDAAEQHFCLAVRANPEFTQAWISLAATLATKSEFPEARKAIDHALRLEPHNAQAEQMKRMLPAASAGR